VALGFGFAAPKAWAQAWAYRDQGHFHLASYLVDPDDLRGILEDFGRRAHGRAYRDAGDRNDWFHGHFLYAESAKPDARGMMKPYAILYHTQEEASRFHRETPGGRYDYLDRATRNWVQFLETDGERLRSGTILNAFGLMFDFLPDTPAYRRGLEATRSHYTVFAEQLDWRKFPVSHRERAIGMRQFDFDAVECGSAPVPDFVSLIGYLELRLPSAPRLCVRATATTAYLPIESAQGLECTLANDARLEGPPSF